MNDIIILNINFVFLQNLGNNLIILRLFFLFIFDLRLVRVYEARIKFIRHKKILCEELRITELDFTSLNAGLHKIVAIN